MSDLQIIDDLVRIIIGHGRSSAGRERVQLDLQSGASTICLSLDPCQARALAAALLDHARQAVDILEPEPEP